MSSLTATEKRTLEQVLGMGDGYVLGFSDRTFSEFVLDTVKIEIYTDKYAEFGTSKANHLRAFWKVEPDPVVAQLLSALLDYAADEGSGGQHLELLPKARKIVDRLAPGGQGHDVAAVPPDAERKGHDRITPSQAGWRALYTADPRPLGRGAQARILRATSRTTAEVVAIKEILVDDEDSLARMRREIEVLGKATHRNIMPILEADESSRWYAMPLAARRLADVGRPLGTAELRECVTQCVQGLEFAHSLNYLHRDITPNNILWLGGTDARWVLADWGLARRPAGMTTVGRTLPGELFGTEDFAAPEMWKDAHRADARADIYSLGRVVAWALGCDLLPRQQVLPSGPWRDFVRQTTATEPDRRPSNLTDLRVLLANAGETVATSPEEELATALSGNAPMDYQVAERIVESALAEPTNFDIILDWVPRIRTAMLADLLRKRPTDVTLLLGKLAEGMVGGTGAWGQRDWDHANECMGWMFDVASLALQSGNGDLADDALDALFRCEPECVRFKQRKRTRNWLRSIRGTAAGVVAVALKRHPKACAWYLDEGWEPSGADPRVQQVLVAASPKKSP